MGGCRSREAIRPRCSTKATSILIDNSTFNGHPRFLGYINGIGCSDRHSGGPARRRDQLERGCMVTRAGGHRDRASGDSLGRRLHRVPDVVRWPVRERRQHGRTWFASSRRELEYARRAGWEFRAKGMDRRGSRQATVYTSAETHTWVQKASELFGLGADAVRWIETDSAQRMRMDLLRERIAEDRRAGYRPFMVIGTGGSVSTGAVDPLPEIAALCRAEGLWFHVDGAYGAPAARVPGVPPELAALGEADSVAMDPHKWFYAPLEAGCVLVRDPETLRAPFTHKPSYYHFHGLAEDPPINFYDWGPQNSRGFRALKVWLAFRQMGRAGYTKMISDDIALARRMYDRADAHPELEALTCALSITTFRYVPPDLPASLSPDERAEYLNDLNEALLTRLQEGGAVYLSNAVIDGAFALRACIVNFRTSAADVDAIPEIVAREGRLVAAGMAR
jgi:glutamate/tyrosine decarboxylase-like PLP-dependent enzyme